MALSECATVTDENSREINSHGTEAFPVACYHDDLQIESVPWHWHDEWEAVVVECGETKVSIGQEEHTVKAGDGFFINSGLLHGCWNDRPEESCLFHSIVFSPSLIGGPADSIFWEKYLMPIQKNYGMKLVLLHQEVSWEREALEALENAWQICNREPEEYEFRIRAELSHFAALLFAHRNPVKASYPMAEQRREERIKQMLTFIRQHYAEDINTGKIAESAMVSESECLRCFRSMLGTTPIQYLKEYRLEKAEELLRTSKMKVSEIGDRCGFREMSYFARSFRQRYGVVPSEYHRCI